MRVLFVCSGNAHRSPLAEALMKKLRSDVEADSAGTHVAIPVSEDVKRYLKEENAEQYLKERPEGLHTKNLRDYDLIIAMEAQHERHVLSQCRECGGKTLVWSIEDPYYLASRDARRVYDHIREKVAELARTV